MNQTDKLINELREYMAKTGEKPSMMGFRAMGDYACIQSIISGKRSPTLKTLDKLRDYMRKNK